MAKAVCIESFFQLRKHRHGFAQMSFLTARDYDFKSKNFTIKIPTPRFFTPLSCDAFRNSKIST